MTTAPHRRTRRIDDRAAASLALGVAGLFLFNAVFGPLAIALGLLSARRNRNRAALIGAALGVADLLVLAALVVGQLHGGSLHWSF